MYIFFFEFIFTLYMYESTYKKIQMKVGTLILSAHLKTWKMLFNYTLTGWVLSSKHKKNFFLHINKIDACTENHKTRQKSHLDMHEVTVGS